MATIGTLAVNVVANTGGLTRGLNRGRGQVKQFQSSIAGTTGGARGLTSTLVGLGGKVAAVAGIALSAKAAFTGLRNQMNKLDATAKTADRLGLTIKQLEGLRHAANLSGVEAGTLEMALQRMTRRISEAANGTGEAKGAIQELGLSAAALENAGPAASIAAIAEAFQKVENPADRVRLAMKLFDSEGVKLVNMLNGGSDALTQAGKDIDKYGAALSRVDAKTIEDANDAIAQMWKSLEGLGSSLTLMFAPAFQTFAQIIADVANQVTRLLRPVLKLIGRDLGEAAEKGLADAAQKAKNLKHPLEEDAEAAKQLKQQMDELRDRGAQVTASLRQPAEVFADTLEELQSLVQAGAIEWETYRRGVERATKELREQQRAQREVQRTAGVGAAVRGTSDAFSAGQASVRLQRDMVDAAKKQLEENKRMVDLLQRIEQNTKEQFTLKAVDI